MGKYKVSGKFLRKLSLILVSIFLCTVTGCCQGITLLSEKDAAKLPTHYSAWLAYWDAKAGAKEARQAKNKLEELVYFGAYFKEDGSLFYPEELIEERKALSKLYKGKEYVSVVNDVITGQDSSKQKDTAILKTLLANADIRQKHIAELIAFAKAGNFTGLELDYENIWKDTDLTREFPLFVAEVYAAARQNDLKLRIVLEPSTPFKQVQWTKGPEYVVMAYNLYGLHSDAGPKANQNFIYKLLASVQNLPEPRTIAFSTGGCLWTNKQKPRFLTEEEAVQLLKANQVETVRDKDSGCLVGKYRIKTEVEEIWYADAKTLELWTLWAKEGKLTNVAFWRLGGNKKLWN